MSLAERSRVLMLLQLPLQRLPLTTPWLAQAC
jgi:hypothetical protein